MKREYRNAITKAIKESNLNGYKWEIIENGNGLKWSYGVEFKFAVYEKEGCISVKNNYYTVGCVTFGDGKYDNCKTLEEAYYLVTKQAIRTANNLY